MTARVTAASPSSPSCENFGDLMNFASDDELPELVYDDFDFGDCHIMSGNTSPDVPSSATGIPHGTNAIPAASDTATSCKKLTLSQSTGPKCPCPAMGKVISLSTNYIGKQCADVTFALGLIVYCDHAP